MESKFIKIFYKLPISEIPGEYDLYTFCMIFVFPMFCCVFGSIAVNVVHLVIV